jgi:ribosome-associated translation inhibitor RaiA
VLVQVSTDNHIRGSASLTERVEGMVTGALERYAERITRIEVFLRDDNAQKHGANDKECSMEARLGGLKPITVTHSAPSVELAIEGAMEKLDRALERATARAAKASSPPTPATE